MPGPRGREEARAGRAGGLGRGGAVIGCGRGRSISSVRKLFVSPRTRSWGRQAAQPDRAKRPGQGAGVRLGCYRLWVCGREAHT